MCVVSHLSIPKESLLGRYNIHLSRGNTLHRQRKKLRCFASAVQLSCTLSILLSSFFPRLRLFFRLATATERRIQPPTQVAQLPPLEKAKKCVRFCSSGAICIIGTPLVDQIAVMYTYR